MNCGNLGARVAVVLARTPAVVRGAPHGRRRERREEDEQPDDLTGRDDKRGIVQCSCSGWPTGNGKKVSNSQACCLAQLCLAPA